MTSTTYFKGYRFRYEAMIESLLWIDRYGFFDEERLDDVVAEIVYETNNMLPGSMFWTPSTSEVSINVEEKETATLDADGFDQIYVTALRKVLEPYGFC